MVVVIAVVLSKRKSDDSSDSDSDSDSDSVERPRHETAKVVKPKSKVNRKSTLESRKDVIRSNELKTRNNRPIREDRRRTPPGVQQAKNDFDVLGWRESVTVSTRGALSQPEEDYDF